MNAELFIISMIIALLLGIFLGHYMAFVLGGIAVIFAYFTWGPSSFFIFANKTFEVMDSYILLAIPLFVLMAQFLEKGKIAERLFNAVWYLFRSVRGGVAVTVVVVSTMLGACTGIIGASIVTMSLIGLPVMLKLGYDKRMACGVIAAGGCLGILIPPSIMLIIMAELGQESVGRLFAGAIIPGLILSGMYISYILLKAYFKPETAPIPSPEEMGDIRGKRLLLMVSKSLIPPALLIIGVLGSIFTGIATPTEASGVGSFLAFLLMVAYGDFSWKALHEAVVGTTKITTMILFILIGAKCFTGVFMFVKADAIVNNLILGSGLGKWGIFLVMMIILFIMGLFLDWTAIVMITFPIFLPIGTELGFDRVWFIVTMAVMLQDSFLTPPFGAALFYLKGTAPKDVKTSDIYWGTFPFWRLMELGLIIVVLFPGTVTWLPGVMFDK